LSDLSKKVIAIKNDTLVLKFEQTQDLLLSLTQKLEKEGYGTSSLLLLNHQIIDQTLIADLDIQLSEKRKLDKIEIKSTTKTPNNLIQQLLKHKTKQPLTNNLLSEIDKDLQQLPFITQLKSPEILFTRDSTKVYLYPEKNNANTFDGIIGFNNEENGKVKFNGYLNLQLLNILNQGESFNLQWKNDGNKQTTFDLNSEIPYIFNSPLGIRGQIEIFKQDSTFQNTKLNINLGYYLSYNSKLYLGFQSTNSSAPETIASIQNFSSKFTTLSYEYKQYQLDDLLFPIKSKIAAQAGTGKRDLDIGNNKQNFIQLKAENNFTINSRNNFYTQLNFYNLFSKEYISNELPRIGGQHSIRGFQENSLQGSFFTIINTEYRYKLSPTLYIHSILDYASIDDKSTRLKNTLYAFGIGFGILTKTGKLNFAYANGNIKGQSTEFKNSILHLSFTTLF